VKNERPGGFTLIELLMVIVVIGILFGMVTSAVMHAQRGARRQKARADHRTIAAGIQFYKQQYGHWPLDDEDLQLTLNRFRVFSNDNHRVITCLRTNSLGRTFLNEGDYVYDDQTNIATPWGEAYLISINAKNSATNHSVTGVIPADSVRVTNVTWR